ncbi:MAG: hypothetical protein ACREKN_01515 [Longimicrobiaceae bacterium]
MSRYALVVTSLLVLAPALGEAQLDRSLPHARFTVTPYLGLRVPYTTQGTELLVSDQDTVFRETRQQYEAAPVAGVSAEFRVRGPFGVTGSFAFSPSRDRHITLVGTDGATSEFRTDGSDLYLWKFGVSLRLPEPSPDTRRFPVAGYISAGPTFVHDSQEVLFADGERVGRSVTSPGLALNGEGVLPLGIWDRRLALNFGLDNHVVFWDNDGYSDEDVRIFQDPDGETLVIDYDYRPAYLGVLRLGASFRF